MCRAQELPCVIMACSSTFAVPARCDDESSVVDCVAMARSSTATSLSLCQHCNKTPRGGQRCLSSGRLELMAQREQSVPLLSTRCALRQINEHPTGAHAMGA